jgi:hypothetical protein
LPAPPPTSPAEVGELRAVSGVLNGHLDRKRLADAGLVASRAKDT